MDEKTYYSLYSCAHNNAVDLLAEAKLLFGAKHYARAYFLALTALEEIAKSQLAADVYTGFISEEEFHEKFTYHGEKLKSVKWATLDANEYAYGLRSLYGKDFLIKKPSEKKRMAALYTDIKQNKVTIPKETIKSIDAESIIETVSVALRTLVENVDFHGRKIGTKGFM